MDGRSRFRTYRAVRKSMGTGDVYHGPNIDKMRTMSTSTPIISQSSSKMECDFSPLMRSLSVSVCSSINDSGYAESLLDVECCGGTSPCDVVSSSSRCKCVSIDLEHSLCLSPFDKRFNLDVSNVDEKDLGVDWEIPDEENIYEKFQSTPMLDIPRYNLDTDSDSDHITEPDSALGASNLIDRFQQVLAKFSPKEPDRLIGRKMGLSGVDIIGELLDRNMSCVVRNIFDYLEPTDLCRLVQVNSRWKTGCYDDVISNSRRRKFIKEERHSIPGKENVGRSKKKKVHRGLIDSGNGDRKLVSLQFVGFDGNKSDLERSPISPQENLFLQAASCLKSEEVLKKCPKCQHPAKVLPVQERGQCQNDNCLYDFCVKCFCEFHGARTCIPVSSKRTKTDSIGSKKSKKNLKRL